MAAENAKVTTSAFLGINRLPEGEEGEGTRFRNLSLDLYPAASTCGFCETGEAIYIMTSDLDSEVDFSKLQAVAEIYEKDGRMYLTGVYDGVFYYEGAAKEYYNAVGTKQRKMTADDTVEVSKAGKMYIIFAKGENDSIIWTYSPDGITGTEADGKLCSSCLNYIIGNSSRFPVYMYRMRGENDASSESLAILEQETKKQYYMVFIRPTISGNTEERLKNYSESRKYEDYTSLYGVELAIEVAAGYDFSGAQYQFDDGDAEHPVRFVIDAASAYYYGSNSDMLLDKLYENEGTRFEITASPNIDQLMTPWTYPKSDSSEYTYVYMYDPTGGMGSYTTYTTPIKTGAGIIGHFEKWNDEYRRYESFRANNEYAIYQGENYVAENGLLTYSAIKLKCAGIKTQGAELSHMTLYKNRVFGCVNDGSMIICSALGDYTDFSEYQGVSTDSGYFNSLTGGEYTGICEYQGTLIAFKADRMSIYYGDTPSDMYLAREIKNIGCIDSRSICEVNGGLYFLGNDGFYVYSGGQPTVISRKLAKSYSVATAFCAGRKYYAAVDDELLIYDTDTNCWTSSQKFDIKAICGGRLFLSDGSVQKLAGREEWSGGWEYESMNLFEGMMDDKGINEIYIRARLDGEMTVSTITDEEEFIHRTITDAGEKMRVWKVPVKFTRGHYYRIRLCGVGKCVLYAIERRVYAGGRTRL